MIQILFAQNRLSLKILDCPRYRYKSEFWFTWIIDWTVNAASASENWCPVPSNVKETMTSSEPLYQPTSHMIEVKWLLTCLIGHTKQHDTIASLSFVSKSLLLCLVCQTKIYRPPKTMWSLIWAYFFEMGSFMLKDPAFWHVKANCWLFVAGSKIYKQS